MKDVDCLRDRLIEVARLGKTIPYCEVAELLGRDISKPEERSAITRILNDIAYQENAEGRPLLSAVVVLPEIGYPGRGFFILARELGFNNFDDECSYYWYELKRVHAYWKTQSTVSQTAHFMTVKHHEVRVGV